MNHNADNRAVAYIWATLLCFKRANYQPSELWRCDGKLYCVGDWRSDSSQMSLTL